MRTRSGSNRAGRGGRGGQSNIAANNASDATASNSQTGRNVVNRIRSANRYRSVGNRQVGDAASSFNAEFESNTDQSSEENARISLANSQSSGAPINSRIFNEDVEYTVRNPVSIYRPPVQQHAPRSSGSDGSGSTGTCGSKMFAPPEKEPENPIPFKAALEFLPKHFDGENMSVGRFISDCLAARDSIATKDRHYLFLMIRSRVVGNAFNALQERDLHTLEDLLKHLKNTYTEHPSLSQLNTALATTAQRENETVLQYGARVSKILASLIELIEDKNVENAARFMIKSARDTACENFVMGLRPNLIWRVRVERPETLQEAINFATRAEWEVEFESGLDRKGIDKKTETRDKSEGIGKDKSYNNARDRFRPY